MFRQPLDPVIPVLFGAAPNFRRLNKLELEKGVWTQANLQKSYEETVDRTISIPSLPKDLGESKDAIHSWSKLPASHKLELHWEAACPTTTSRGCCGG